MTTLWVVFGVAATLIIFIISLYNRLVKYRNTREKAFADIDVQLKQRHDLIPLLMENVKGYMNYENKTIIAVTQARAAAISAGNINEKIDAENKLSSALSGLKVSIEAYPDLKASASFIILQEEISDVENKLAATRRYFNSTTKEYNNSVETFPANIIAGVFGFSREKMFEVGDSERVRLDKAPDSILEKTIQ
jgi:Uncharacterized conserved protein